LIMVKLIEKQYKKEYILKSIVKHFLM